MAINENEDSNTILYSGVTGQEKGKAFLKFILQYNALEWKFKIVWFKARNQRILRLSGILGLQEGRHVSLITKIEGIFESTIGKVAIQ